MTELDSMLAQTAGRIFTGAPHDGGAFDAATWAATAEAGLDCLLLSEEAGGAGDAFEAAAALATVFGAHAAPIPFVETLVANWCLDRAGLTVPPGPKALFVPLHAEASQQMLGWVIAGSQTVAVAPAGPGSRIALFDTVPAGVPRTTLAGEPALAVSAADFTGAPVAAGPSALPLDTIRAVFATLKAAAIVGALETALAMTIEYANSRKQFGRRIGAFQAVQHMIACMAEETAAAAASVQKAARSAGRPNGLFTAAVAKSRTGEAAYPVAAMAHQCHGAIGFTREYALHRFTTRIMAWRDEAGSADYWHGRLGEAALRCGSAGLWAGMTEGSLL